MDPCPFVLLHGARLAGEVVTNNNSSSKEDNSLPGIQTAVLLVSEESSNEDYDAGEPITRNSHVEVARNGP